MDHEKWLEQHDRMMADSDIRMARLEKDMTEGFAELRASHAQTERTLRRAIRLSVLDARRQRRRNREFDEKITQLISSLKKLLERGGNGFPPSQ